ENLPARLHRHNAGWVRYTARYRPWRVVGAVELATRAEAVRLERHLKRLKNPRKVFNFLDSTGSIVEQ
ncbi:MAG: GIY-YIG nuclease family protein, partial [bacterium]